MKMNKGINKIIKIDGAPGITLEGKKGDTGKNGAWINDTPVTRTDLALFSSFLVDIHGQHEHQSLLNTSRQLKMLDAFAKDDTEDLLVNTLFEHIVTVYILDVFLLVGIVLGSLDPCCVIAHLCSLLMNYRFEATCVRKSEVLTTFLSG